jgi:hypothetical protein
MMAALDDRIRVAVPVVGTSDFFEQIQVTRELDWYAAAEHCHFVPGLIQYADNHELLAMIAPRPLLIVSASVDQSFPVKGVQAVHAYGESLYRSCGAAERIAYFEDAKEGHGYQKAKREAAYGWFLRHLAGRGDGGAMAEPETATLPFDAPELRCFSEGKQAAGPAMNAAARRLTAGGASSAERLRRLMGSAPAATGAAPLERRSSGRVERHTIASEGAIEIPALLLEGEGRPAVGTVIAIDDRGKESLASDPVVEEALRRKWSVLAIDPRGIGELELVKPG